VAGRKRETMGPTEKEKKKEERGSLSDQREKVPSKKQYQKKMV